MFSPKMWYVVIATSELSVLYHVDWLVSPSLVYIFLNRLRRIWQSSKWENPDLLEGGGWVGGWCTAVGWRFYSACPWLGGILDNELTNLLRIWASTYDSCQGWYLNKYPLINDQCCRCLSIKGGTLSEVDNSWQLIRSSKSARFWRTWPCFLEPDHGRPGI